VGIVTALVWTYFAITFVTFLLSAFVSMTGMWPATVQVPWSRLGSFVESRDGILLTEITMWGRIERYDRKGRFLGSWRQPFAKGSVALATDENGRSYLRHANNVYLLGPDGKLLNQYTAPADFPRSWRLAESGEPQYAPDILGSVERKVVRRGQVLFSDNASRYFVALDGSLLRPAGHSLTRVGSDEQTLITYQGPKYFWPVLFPLPAGLAWICGLILIIIRAAK
jgi:hypothetical protein